VEWRRARGGACGGQAAGLGCRQWGPLGAAQRRPRRARPALRPAHLHLALHAAGLLLAVADDAERSDALAVHAWKSVGWGCRQARPAMREQQQVSAPRSCGQSKAAPAHTPSGAHPCSWRSSGSRPGWVDSTRQEGGTSATAPPVGQPPPLPNAPQPSLPAGTLRRRRRRPAALPPKPPPPSPPTRRWPSRMKVRIAPESRSQSPLAKPW
jgi:hypothetical protein